MGGGLEERKIAVVGGTGDQGFGLALRWCKAGEHVIIGSRDAAKAQAAAGKVREILGVGAKVEGAVNPEAVAAAGVVVLTVPFAAHIPILKSIRQSLKPGTTLVDVSVPLEAELGGSPTRTVSVWPGSAAEQCARLVPSHVRVVSAFNNVPSEALRELEAEVDCDVIVCGDDGEAKRVVRELVRAIPGLRFIDGGGLENARVVEQLTALLIGINLRYGSGKAGVRITGISPT